jgi:5-methylcytosine-specific restriction enzyme subunit McrC
MVSPIACRFDEHTADIAENRILKAAVRRFLRVAGVTPDTRQHLLRELSHFDEVADTAVDPDMVDRLVFTRLNRHYEAALRLARLALRATSLTDTAGDLRASAFLLDMNELFERFVTERLRRALRGHLRVLSQTRHYLGVGRAVPMRPDLEFVTSDRTVYVADVKYKLTDTGLGRNADYYQLFAYTTALRLPEGMLIYCHAKGEAPRSVEVRHAGTRLQTRAVDLSGQAIAVETSMAALADAIAERALS